MLGDIPIDDEDLQSFLELCVSKFEKLDCVIVITDLLDGWPLKVDLWELDCFLFTKCDAVLIELNETTD